MQEEVLESQQVLEGRVSKFSEQRIAKFRPLDSSASLDDNA